MKRLRVPEGPKRSHCRGATLVEFVIAGPLVLFILLVLMQYALLFHARSQLNYAANAAATRATASRWPAITVAAGPFSAATATCPAPC